MRVDQSTVGDGRPRPWASFCLATYRRRERLEATLRSILAQTFTDFEVIVTDNDPEQSAKSVVEAIGDPRLFYHANEQNLGMVKNFNRALSLAVGSWVVMITDDDPVYPDMLATLNDLWKKNPGFGAYFAACEVDFQDEAVAAMYGRKSGRVRCLANRDEGAVWSLAADDFVVEFFHRRVLPYILWSCGIVRRDIALEVGGMPDYGSPFLTDYGYVALVGSREGVCCVNTAVGFQAVHSGNFGRRETGELVAAVVGLHAYVERYLGGRPTWPRHRLAMEELLSSWFFDHLFFLWQFHRGSAKRREVLSSVVEGIKVPYLRRKVRSFALRCLRSDVGHQVRRFRSRR